MNTRHAKRAAGAKRPGAGQPAGALTRREFLKAGAAGAALMLTGSAWGASAPASLPASASRPGGRPNFLFLSADELGLDALSGLGCTDVRTPNMDRLVRRGVSFMQSYSTNPICSPARSSWFTGRMPSETGVVYNTRPIREGMPTMGALLRDGGYDTYYAGKWHMPAAYTNDIAGFRVLPGGIVAHGALGDMAVSQACRALLRNRRGDRPFLLTASILQPHDIVSWSPDHRKFPPQKLPYGLTEDRLPQLPPNFSYDAPEPKALRLIKSAFRRWTETQWRYYLWSYYRHVEMADAEIGRILDALDGSPYADNTIIVFTSDHGEGRARHGTVMKNFFYEEAAKVPLIVSWPARAAQDVRDAQHLVSGADILPTICDYAGVNAPAGVVGRSLRPLLEGKDVPWRDAVVAEASVTGRMVRSRRYKFITYQGDPVEQLFDLQDDPWETRNLAGEAQFAAALADHRKLLADWEARLDPAPLPDKDAKAPGEEE